MEEYKIQEKENDGWCYQQKPANWKQLRQQHHNYIQSQAEDCQNDFCDSFGLYNLLGAVFHSTDVVCVGWKVPVGW